LSCAAGSPGELAALHLHLVRGLPGADDHFADPAHRLRVRRKHREGAQVVENVLGGDRLAPDPRFGKRDVFGNRRVEVMAHHQHVEVLVDRVDGVRARRVGRRRQHVRLAARPDDVGRMAAARALGVVRVDRAAADRVERRLDEAGFVQRVSMDRDLHVHLVGDLERGVDRRRRRAPVFVQLESDRARFHLLDERRDEARVALAEEAQVHRERFRRFEHPVHVPGAGRARGGERAGGRTRAAADHRRHARHQRLVDLLRTDEMDVRIDPARGDDHPFAGDDFGGSADDDVHTGLDVRVARLAELRDPAILDRNVALDDAPPVDDERVGDHRVGRVLRHPLALAHAVANHLAAAEFHLLAVDREIALDFDDELGVRETHAIAGRRPEHLGIRPAADLHRRAFVLALGFPLRAGAFRGGERRGAVVRERASSGPITAPAKP
jgi:hypothetical protein